MSDVPSEDNSPTSKSESRLLQRMAVLLRISRRKELELAAVFAKLVKLVEKSG